MIDPIAQQILIKMKLTMEKAKLVEMEQAMNLVGRPNKKQLDIAVVQIFLWKGDDVWKKFGKKEDANFLLGVEFDMCLFDL